jgi:hypothetical protein
VCADRFGFPLHERFTVSGRTARHVSLWGRARFLAPMGSYSCFALALEGGGLTVVPIAGAGGVRPCELWLAARRAGGAVAPFRKKSQSDRSDVVCVVCLALV